MAIMTEAAKTNNNARADFRGALQPMQKSNTDKTTSDSNNSAIAKTFNQIENMNSIAIKGVAATTPVITHFDMRAIKDDCVDNRFEAAAAIVGAETGKHQPQTSNGHGEQRC